MSLETPNGAAVDFAATEIPQDLETAHTSTLRLLREEGVPVAQHGDDGTDTSSQDLLAFQTGMSDPLSRIYSSDAKPFNTLVAVARLTWLLAGSDRLEDIAYYEPKVRKFTDNQLSVPGSSYGRRLFAASPGLDQIASVVQRLREDPASRRASAVIWLPEDAVRHSNDIPCTFGLFFHIREGRLVMTTIMRSNNAATLLPYNLFEFSMLGEMVATDVGVPFGRYLHWAASMHTYNSMAQMVDATLADGTRRSIRMPEMPAGGALAHGRALAVFEARLRNAPTVTAVEEVAKEAAAELPDYWMALFNVLLAFGLAKREEAEMSLSVLASLPDYLRGGASTPIKDHLGTVPDGSLDESDTLFPAEDLEMSDTARRAQLVADAPFATGSGQIEFVLRTLRTLSSPGRAITLPEIDAVIDDLTSQSTMGLAARGSKEPKALTSRDVAEALERVRPQDA